MGRYRTPIAAHGRSEVQWRNMDPQIESPVQSRVRVFPGWVRAVVWLSVAFLAISVIGGMFLY
jgi:hypothetical protein